jgi:hypothetical protein
MGGDESLGHLDPHPANVRFSDRTSIESVPERFTVEQFDDHEGLTVMRADVVYLDDVRVIEGCRDSRFTKKPNDAQFVWPAERCQHFQRDLAIQPGVGRPIDDAHTAPSDDRVDVIRTDERAGPQSRLVRRQLGGHHHEGGRFEESGHRQARRGKRIRLGDEIWRRGCELVTKLPAFGGIALQPGIVPIRQPIPSFGAHGFIAFGPTERRS